MPAPTEPVRESAKRDREQGRWPSHEPTLALTCKARAKGAHAFCPASDELARGLGEQVGVDEAVEVAVEDALRVPGLVVRSVVLDELVRVQHVAPDVLAAEPGVDGSTL